MTTEQDKRRKAAAASKAVQALAQAVQAGRAGQPPAPEALAVLADVLQALQDGTDPGKALGLKRATAGKPPADKELEARAVRRMLELRNQHLDLSDAKVAERVAGEFVAQQVLELRNQGLSDAEIAKLVEDKPRVTYATLYENWFLGKGRKNQKVDDRVQRTYRGEAVRKVTPLRAKLEREQQDDAQEAAVPPPMPDRPDASEDFKGL